MFPVCFQAESDPEELFSETFVNTTSRRSLSPSRSFLSSTKRSQSAERAKSPGPRPDETVAQHNNHFLVTHKDDKLLGNRDFSTFKNPKPRRSRSPTRRARSSSPIKSIGNVTSESIPGKHTVIFDI